LLQGNSEGECGATPAAWGVECSRCRFEAEEVQSVVEN